MGTVFRFLIIVLLVGALILLVAGLFCAGLADIIRGGTCGQVLALIDWLKGQVSWAR